MDEMDIGREMAGPRAAPAVAFLALLAAGAVLYQGYHALIALGDDDTNHLETPLLLATARQLEDGPSTLYGPFSGDHPLVLIHAPLYYRAAAALAWPIARSGLDPDRSALIAGRALSTLALLALLAAAYRIARQGGSTALSGWIAALLVASCPVLGSFGFTVRADMLGLALQTWGFALAMKALREGMSARPSLLVGAGILFGLAACAKQHFVVSAGIALALLVVAATRGRLSRPALALGVATGLLVLGSYYGWEEWVTGGMMSRSVFVVPGLLRRTEPGSWTHLATVAFESTKLAAGLVLVTVACLVAGGPRRCLDRRDAPLWIALLGESAAIVPLCLGSSGAWVNYAMPAAVWASVLLGRAAARSLGRPGLRTWALPMAGLAVLAADARLVAISMESRSSFRTTLQTLLADPFVAELSPRDRYFVSLPQINRLHGRSSLAHDEWLYESYAAAGMAEPRSDWLARELTGNEGVRVVALKVPPDRPPPDLPALGYRLHQQYGPFAVWVREGAGATR